ncbi:VAMP713 protein [Hibiscus syriacus]|uniref:VAMP713 protein n=1 Tax=Hibiscus syriacus TaxID=106335 RepID=A0A6A2XF05_HIBSY|nr:VAMP713 protein [Hibiscus syriacus]
MAILYALVARGSVVLAEFTAASTNASTVARQILDNIPGDSDINVSYSQDRYIFHVKRTDGLTVLCMADESAGSQGRYIYRFVLQGEFLFHFLKTFIRDLLKLTSDSDPNADRINRLKGEMSQVRTVMTENIDKVLERGDRLELLVDKTTNMVSLIILLLVVVYVVLAFVCDGIALPSCLK